MSRHEVSTEAIVQCAGDRLSLLTSFTSLAFCELYLSLTALVLRVFPHMQLFETTQRDVAYHHELFVPMAEPGSKGVRVLMV